MARDNRAELEKTVAHYQASGDTLKMKAAMFLIENMPGKNSFAPRDQDTYQVRLCEMGALCDTLWWDPAKAELGHYIDSRLRLSDLRPQWTNDLRTLTSDFLIRHIDAMFALWETAPWHDRYTFDEFCEWVLPYRIGNERPEEWPSVALSGKHPREDSARRAGDLFGLGLVLINNTGIRYNAAMGGYPFTLAFSETNTVRWGTCNQMTDYAVKLFRSRGIPASADVIVAWADRSAGHQWNVIVQPDSTCRDIGYNPYGRNIFDYRMPKIYRQTYRLQRDTPLFRYRISESIPEHFRRFDLIDVTAQYDMPLAEVTVAGLDTTVSRIAYLATFNNHSWIPVTYAEIIDGEARFRDLGCGHRPRKQTGRGYLNQGDGLVYLPCYYVGGRVVPASAPIVVHGDRSVELIQADTSQLQTVILSRKYPESRDVHGSKRNMRGGRFEGADHPDFRGARLLSRIATQPGEGTQRQLVREARPCRYVRFVTLDTADCGIAEITFFSDTTLLIGTPLCSSTKRLKGAANAFDGDILTYYTLSKDSSDYIGLDFGQPRTVTAIEYTPRTDDNGIEPGQAYELYWWDGRWRSLGRQTAITKQLNYAGVPHGALLLLRNLTKGIENRIFTIASDGHQNWW